MIFFLILSLAKSGNNGQLARISEGTFFSKPISWLFREVLHLQHVRQFGPGVNSFKHKSSLKCEFIFMLGISIGLKSLFGSVIPLSYGYLSF